MGQNSAFLEFLIVFGTATGIVTLSHLLRLPSIVGFLLTGLLIGPYGFELIPSISGVHTVNEVAVVLLMFTIGLEFSPRHLLALRRAFFGVGACQVFGTALAIGLLAHFVLRLSAAQSVIAGFLAALSSTAIIMKLLQDNYDMASPHGNTTLGVTLFQDVAAILIMLAVPLMAKDQVSTLLRLPATPGSFAAELATAVVLIAFAAKFAVPLIIRRVVATRSRELFFFCILFLCFGGAYGAHKIGFSYPLGAFIAGVMIADSPYGKQASSEIIPLRDNFLGFFFISLGMLLDPRFILGHFPLIVALALAVFGAKIAITYGAARSFRYSHSVAIMTAIILFQIGEFSFVLADAARAAQIFNAEQFQYFLALSLLSMVLTPFAYRLAPKLTNAMARSHLEPSPYQEMDSTKSIHAALGHAVIIGYGVAGRHLAETFWELGIDSKIIDLNYAVVKELQAKGHQAIYGDASRQEILEAADAINAKLIVVVIAGKHMVPAILSTLTRMRSKAHVILRTQYAREGIELANQEPNIEIVVSELESAREILARSLRAYEVPSTKISELTAHAAERFASILV